MGATLGEQAMNSLEQPLEIRHRASHRSLSRGRWFIHYILQLVMKLVKSQSAFEACQEQLLEFWKFTIELPTEARLEVGGSFILFCSLTRATFGILEVRHRASHRSSSRGRWFIHFI